MPELPEVECVRHGLERAVVGRRVTSTRISRADVLDTRGSRGRTPGAALLRGQQVVGTLRHGKQLALVGGEGSVVCVHLGMTGQLLVRGPRARAPVPSHAHVAWRLDDGSRLLFRDARRFGGLWTFMDEGTLRAARWDHLGPDALQVRSGVLAPRLAATRRSLKAALLDQRVIAGLGNIYVDEACFRARIRPTRPAPRLGKRDVPALTRAIRATLRRAIEAGGSTIRDYQGTSGEPGGYQNARLVYGRRGMPCRRCGTILVGELVAQRSTVWCPECQS